MRGVMRSSTLESTLQQIAAEVAAAEPEAMSRVARVHLLREAVGPVLADCGWLAVQLELRMLDGRLPCSLALHAVCQAALDRWLGRPQANVSVSGQIEHTLSPDLLHLAARERIIEGTVRVLEIGSVVSSIPPIVPPSSEPEEVVVTDPEHPGDLVEDSQLQSTESDGDYVKPHLASDCPP